MTVSTEIATPQNPPNRETQISWYLALQIQIEILFEFESVSRNLSFWIWWISGGYHFQWTLSYGVALVSRIDKMIGLFCKRALQKRRYSAKVTYNFIDPTDRSHPIAYLSLLKKGQGS